MSIKTFVETIQQQEIYNDMENNELDQDKLAALKAKMAKKEQENMPPKIIQEKQRSIKFGAVGSGQAGGKLASQMYSLGYPAIAINTAPQDLADIEVPEANKLLLKYGLGGAAKDLTVGHAAAEAYAEEINDLINRKLSDCEVILFCTSLGGGSGAGSSEIIVEILSKLELPIVVMTVLPQTSDDVQVKSNALQTLSKFTKMVQSKKIANLIVVDNAKIETIYSDVSPLNFFKVSNKAIIDPIDVFNTLSTVKSSVKPLDSQEFGKLFLDGQGLTVYGEIKVSNYQEDTAIAESIVENLNGNLLASGFDLKQARYVGFMLVANEKVWNSIPSSSLNYATSVMNEMGPSGVFKGIYSIDTDEDCITVYSMFSGLGLPADRVEQLKNETKEKLAITSKKDQERNFSLNLQTEEQTVSAADDVRRKIEAKKSIFGKFQGKVVEDRRKK